MTREDILMMARNPYGIYAFTADDLAKFANLIAAEERESCAKVCDGWTNADGDRCAEAIRARGEK